MNNYIYSALLIANDRSLLFHYLRETISSLVISSLRKDQRGPCLIHLSVVHSSQDRPCPSQPFCKKEMDKWKPLKLCVCGCANVSIAPGESPPTPPRSRRSLFLFAHEMLGIHKSFQDYPVPHLLSDDKVKSLYNSQVDCQTFKMI